MNSKFMKILSLGFIISIIIGATAFPTGNSLPTGINNGVIADAVIANGCACHTTGPMSPDVVINLTTLPENYNASQVYTFTLNISGGPEPLEGGNQGGFVITANYGNLESIDNTTSKPEGQTHLTHNEYGNNFREWSFNWTAPESDAQIVIFTIYGNSVNGNAGSSDGNGNLGDYWNVAQFEVAGVIAKEEKMETIEWLIIMILLLSVFGILGYNYYILYDKINKKRDMLELKMAELEGKGIKVDGLKKTIEDIEGNEDENT